MSPPETSEQTEVHDLELEVGERAGWEQRLTEGGAGVGGD